MVIALPVNRLASEERVLGGVQEDGEKGVGIGEELDGD